MGEHGSKLSGVLESAGTHIRGDSVFYLFIVTYTAFGLLLLELTGTADKAAYSVYLWKWITLFLLFFPAMAFVVDYGTVIHRFDKKRNLAWRRLLSTKRLSYFLSGIALLMVMMFLQGTFTSIKNALFVWNGGFVYEKLLADIDAAIHFGVDPWRWLYALNDSVFLLRIVEWNYNVLWFVVCFSALFFVSTSPKAKAIRGRYLTSFMLVWILVGNVLAGMFMSAGPVYYEAVTGDIGRFADQLAFLQSTAGSANSAANYQAYLWELHASGRAGFGSGISAFPSVHVGLITMNALFVWDWNRKLGIVAFAYVLFVLASSVYLAWHYAIDGYAAIVIALAIHYLVKKLPLERWTTKSVGPASAGRRLTEPKAF